MNYHDNRIKKNTKNNLMNRKQTKINLIWLKLEFFPPIYFVHQNLFYRFMGPNKIKIFFFAKK